MATSTSANNSPALERFAAGTVIPAQPLALTETLQLDERRQRALSRYYLAAGAGGIAVGVHSTQFGIHFEHDHLLKPVLSLAADVVRESGDDGAVLVAGACGSTEQAVAETQLAAELGYHAVLLAPYGAGDLDLDQLLDRARAVSEVLPLIGFYLQPSVGGRPLPRRFWTGLAEIPDLVGIKIAPFDRYATLDVLTGIAESDRAEEIALYTGNDDHIVGDLLMRFPLPGGRQLEFVGGLLGQWSVWTAEAVTLLDDCRLAKAGDAEALKRVLDVDGPLTDANAAIFDAANEFRGCLPGVHEMLRRQGLLQGLWCLDPDEKLSPGQLDEIDRIWAAYPQLRDDHFVAEHLEDWLS